MLDAIKHITRDNFFFQEDSAQVHCVCNTVQLSEKCDFRVFPFCQVVQACYNFDTREWILIFFGQKCYQ